jgi:flagellar P-ring protein FlgI
MKQKAQTLLFILSYLILSALMLTITAQAAESRIKDILTIKGVRENPIIGYGLVIGLNGTGDSGGEITDTSLKRMFQTLGLNPQREVSSKNVAAVIVTTTLLPFARMGQKMDVKVSSVGNATSLEGGTLLVTPLKGGDGKIYAIANGVISSGLGDKGDRIKTTAMVINGAIVERDLELNFDEKKSLRLGLNYPDFTTAARVEKTINQNLGGKFAIARDATTIDLIIPTRYERSIVELVAILENFKVNTDTKAKIIVNENTGTIVAGGDVQLLPVAIGHGGLSIQVAPAAEGDAAAAPSGPLHFIDKQTTLSNLVKALNAVGAKPEDLISIFKSLKAHGSIVGELIFI